MSNRIASSIERILRDDGVNVAVRFEPAADATDEPEIAFLTPDEDGVYPVFLQVIGISHASIRIRGYGDDDSAPGQGRTKPLSDLMGIADAVAALIKVQTPIPVQTVSMGPA